MGWRDWTGVGERRWKTAPDEQVQPAKTLWDWLQLLIVPAILIAVTFAWSATQTRNDNKREDRRIRADRVAAEQVRQDATLSDYIQQMSELMLHEKLITPERLLPGQLPKLSLSGQPPHAVEPVARTLTLTTLRRLDGERRGEVVRFLQEADLINSGASHVVGLNKADIQGAHLAGAWLQGVDFTQVDLRGARLAYAILTDAELLLAKLQDANLRHAVLWSADLTGANFSGADLTEASLREADLTEADLTGADLTGADLTDAKLTDAKLTDAKLKGAIGLPKNRP